ncbi:hypothetical protein Pcinc_009521 [Petrolisthes cinctipes]|uniref:Uncharacterized protein n=1 Tax=Petrolisthes cinctipes TaxID=88211 RepID=A0AAE1G4X9_PETCI|nr:hypothetical protein Pcinc_009521 [Petrolisthes cinctipes]
MSLIVKPGQPASQVNDRHHTNKTIDREGKSISKCDGRNGVVGSSNSSSRCSSGGGAPHLIPRGKVKPGKQSCVATPSRQQRQFRTLISDKASVIREGRK